MAYQVAAAAPREWPKSAILSGRAPGMSRTARLIAATLATACGLRGATNRSGGALDRRCYVSCSGSALAGEPTGCHGDKSSRSQFLRQMDVLMRKTVSAVQENDDRKGTR